MTIKLPPIILDPITKRFVQLNDPPKPHKVELTKQDKERVLEEFKEVMEREATEEEKEDLFREERKIKGGKGNGKDCNTGPGNREVLPNWRG